ncbi:MAG: hypothetical protein R2759_03475 [Bacteroidales bacterium]
MNELVKKLMERNQFSDDTKTIIENENLLPMGLLNRLHKNYGQYSGIMDDSDLMFTTKNHYSGLKGFREIIATLNENGIDIGHIEERELFIKIYRFLATKHVLNTINWNNFKDDLIFQLVFPQPGMVKPAAFKAYSEANTDEEKEKLVADYIKSNTNPHDGKQLLNKPWYENENSDLVILDGSQHKYPQVQLLFDKTTQSCFSFCTYCFRHAQVRGDEDMFNQRRFNR